MSAEDSLAVDGNTGATSEDAALAEVLESYLARLEAGDPADPEALIAAHPELAGPLRTCLRAMHLAQGLNDQAEPQWQADPTSIRFPDGPARFTPGSPIDSSALTAIWPGSDPPPQLLLPEPVEDDPPIVWTRSDALAAAPGGSVGATRCWARSPAAAWASCSRPVTPTWAVTWQ